jgi:hypothetical protein
MSNNVKDKNKITNEQLWFLSQYAETWIWDMFDKLGMKPTEEQTDMFADFIKDRLGGHK